MPQMEVEQFTYPDNAELLDMIRGQMDPVYQSRVPAATRAGLDATMNALNSYSPAANQFVDALINLIGAQIVKTNSFTNPLAKYKQGLLNKGETIEEVAIGLIKAAAFNPKDDPMEEELFGRAKNEVQTAFHTINRMDRYKITIQEEFLERAFLNDGGLSKFVAGLMAQINTSDNWDEFLMTADTLRRYYDKEGFFRVNVPDLNDPSADGDMVKILLTEIRTMSDTLPYISRKYNPRHMPVASDKGDLELITTPRVKAKMDVLALSAAFNIDKAQVENRMTTIPEEYMPIPGVQAILTTKRFFTIADKLMAMRSLQNPAGLFNNYWWHHHEIVSASPFENAILFTAEEGDTILVNDYRVSGLSNYTLFDATDGSAVTVTGGAATVQRGHAYIVVIKATTEPANGPLDAVTLRLGQGHDNETNLNQHGLLYVSQKEKSGTLRIHGLATEDNTFESDLTLTVTGPLVEGSVALEVDEDPSTIANTRKPGITPAAGGPVGTELTVNHGSWDTDDLSFAFQWKRDGVAITGATGQTYTTVSADATHTVSVTVTVSKTGQTSGSVTSNGVPITA